jgi:hypothetical protein
MEIGFSSFFKDQPVAGYQTICAVFPAAADLRLNVLLFQAIFVIFLEFLFPGAPLRSEPLHLISHYRESKWLFPPAKDQKMAQSLPQSFPTLHSIDLGIGVDELPVLDNEFDFLDADASASALPDGLEALKSLISPTGVIYE